MSKSDRSFETNCETHNKRCITFSNKHASDLCILDTSFPPVVIVALVSPLICLSLSKVSAHSSETFTSWLLCHQDHLKQTGQMICLPSVLPTLQRAVVNQSILQSQWSITANRDEDWPLIIQFVQMSSRFATLIVRNLLAFQSLWAKHWHTDERERSMRWI